MVKQSAIKDGDKAKLQKYTNNRFNVSPNKFDEIWK